MDTGPAARVAPAWGRVTLGGLSSVAGGPEMALARVALGGLDPVPKLICHPLNGGWANDLNRSGHAAGVWCPCSCAPWEPRAVTLVVVLFLRNA